MDGCCCWDGRGIRLDDSCDSGFCCTISFNGIVDWLLVTEAFVMSVVLRVSSLAVTLGVVTVN